MVTFESHKRKIEDCLIEFFLKLKFTGKSIKGGKKGGKVCQKDFFLNLECFYLECFLTSERMRNKIMRSFREI